jgi:hypothetical protein
LPRKNANDTKGIRVFVFFAFFGGQPGAPGASVLKSCREKAQTTQRHSGICAFFGG